MTARKHASPTVTVYNEEWEGRVLADNEAAEFFQSNNPAWFSVSENDASQLPENKQAAETQEPSSIAQFPRALPAPPKIFLSDSVYCTEERMMLFKLAREGSGPDLSALAPPENAEDAPPGAEPATNVVGKRGAFRGRIIKHPSGMPVLHRIAQPGDAGDEIGDPSYEVHWSTNPGIEKRWFTKEQIDKGLAFTRLGAPMSGISAINMYANLVWAQREAFDIPIEVQPRYTGISHGNLYMLPDGKPCEVACEVGRGGADQMPLPIYRYTFPEARANDWKERFRDLPTRTPSQDDVCELGRFLNYDPRGRALILVGLAARSLVSTIEPIRTVATLVGKTRSGKTTAANFARGIVGPCKSDDLPDGTFTGTNASIETLIGALHDIPFVIDDFHHGEQDTAGERARVTQLIDRLTSSAFDGSQIRSRANRDMTAKVGAVVGGLAILTGEGLDNTITSRLLRMVCMRYELGENDFGEFISGYDPHQKNLWEIGHAIIRRFLEWRARDVTEARLFVRNLDQQYAEDIAATLTAARPQSSAENRRTLSRNYAKACTGAALIDWACGGDAMREALRPFVVALAAAQLDMIEQGGVSSIDREWCARTIREALRGKRAYLEYLATHPGVSGGIPHDKARNNLGRSANDMGWFAGAARDGPALYSPEGSDIGFVSDDRRAFFLRPDATLSCLREGAKRDGGRAFPWSEQTLGEALIRKGFIIAGKDDGVRSAVQLQINGKRARFYHVPVSVLYPDAGDDELSPVPSSGPGADMVGETLAPSPDIAELIEAARSVPRVAPAPETPSAPQARPQNARKVRAGSAATTKAGDAPAPALDDDIPFPAGDTSSVISTARKGAEMLPAGDAPAAISTGDVMVLPPSDTAPDEIPVPAAVRSNRAAAHRPDLFGAIGLDGLYIDGARNPVAEPPDLGGLDQAKGSTTGRLLALMVKRGLTQLWLHPEWCAAAGLPAELPADTGADTIRAGAAHPFAVGALPEGWVASKPGVLRQWLKFYRRGESGTIAIALPGYEDRTQAWASAPNARTLLAAVVAFREATGNFPWRSGPGAMAVGMLRKLHVGHNLSTNLSASMAPKDFPPPARQSGLTPQLYWIREPSVAERAGEKFLHSFDVNAMFLSPCGSLHCGMGKPEHFKRGAIAFDKRRSGYWLARVRFGGVPAWSGLLPHPCYTSAKQADPASGPQWYVSETLSLAAELGALIEISEAWIFPETHRPLEPWYKRLRGGRSIMQGRNDEAARIADAALKSARNQGIGWLDLGALRDSEDEADLYRPNWRHSIIATANANLLRALHKVSKAGAWPVAVNTDEVFFMSEIPDALAFAASIGLPINDGLGKFKVHCAAIPLQTFARAWEARLRFRAFMTAARRHQGEE